MSLSFPSIHYYLATFLPFNHNQVMENLTTNGSNRKRPKTHHVTRELTHFQYKLKHRKMHDKI